MTDRIKWGPTIGPSWKAVAEVAMAMDQGRPVQVRIASLNEWEWQKPSPRLSANFQYRIGEEVKPREFWLNVYDDGVAYIYESREKADQSSGHGRLECIHVREVIE